MGLQGHPTPLDKPKRWYRERCDLGPDPSKTQIVWMPPQKTQYPRHYDAGSG